jgi:hypothetical protein
VEDSFQPPHLTAPPVPGRSLTRRIRSGSAVVAPPRAIDGFRADPSPATAAVLSSSRRIQRRSAGIGRGLPWGSVGPGPDGDPDGQSSSPGRQEAIKRRAGIAEQAEDPAEPLAESGRHERPRPGSVSGSETKVEPNLSRVGDPSPRSSPLMSSLGSNLLRSDRPKHRRASLRASVSSDQWR